MTMKCVYAIPDDASATAQRLAGRYAEALANLSEDVISLGDDLRAFAEMHGVAVLKLNENDWATITETLGLSSDRDLAGELFWAPRDAQRVQIAIDEGAYRPERQTLSAWLKNQVDRERSILLLVT